MARYTHKTKGNGVLKWDDFFGMWKLEGSVAFCLASGATTIPQNSNNWYSTDTQTEITRKLASKGWYRL